MMTIDREGNPVELTDEEFINQAPEDRADLARFPIPGRQEADLGARLHSLGRHQLQRLGLGRVSVAYLILPTAQVLLDAAPGEKIVHIVDGNFRHLRWITMRQAFNL